MEPDGKINGAVVNELDGEDSEIKIEVTTNSEDEEDSNLDLNNEDETENHKNMVNSTITKEEFMKNSDLKLKTNKTIIPSKSKMEGNIASKPNGQSSNLTAPSAPKTNEKKPGARFNSDLSPALNPKKIAKMSPRATRSSQNPDFAAKQRKFLNRVHDPIKGDYSDGETSQENGSPSVTKNAKEKKSPSAERKLITDPKKKSDKEAMPKRTATEVEDEEDGPSKKKRTKEPTKVVGGVDSYCWRCHRDGTVIRCEGCPRVYHLKCVQLEEAPPKGWVCPECIMLMQAENTDTRSRAMRMLSLDQLCNLLRYALNRMKSHEGASDFARAVDVVEFPNYRDYIVKPMDLAQLERNIKTKTYGSTEAFLADAKWIVHNSIIFNSAHSQFTNAARGILKICRQEMQEIENCPDCYQNAHTRSSDSWFIEACRRPHLLVWAKLKGFPFWPAKAMSTNSEGLVDVRFFGAHDRAWVPVNCCYLFSKQSPVPASNKNRRNLEECLEELEVHIKKLRDKFGPFEYPPYKTLYDPKNEEAQLAMFLPKYDAKGAGKRSRLSLLNDGARKSFSGPKSSPTTLAKRLPEDTPPAKPKTSKDDNTGSPTERAKAYHPEMVSFPPDVNGFSDTPAYKSHLETAKQREGQSVLKKKSLEQTPPSKQDGTKKASHRTPLTAAAKKCFAMEEKTCFRCKAVSKSSLNWGSDSDGNTVCPSCIDHTDSDTPQTEADVRKAQTCSKCQISVSVPDDDTDRQSVDVLCGECSRLRGSNVESQIQDKCCSVCHTSITMRWIRNSQGSLLCSSCGFAERFKKAEGMDNGSGTLRGTITVQRKMTKGDDAQAESDISNLEERRSVSKDAPSELVLPVDSLAESAATAGQEITLHNPTESETTRIDFASIDSPPKFVIPKTNLDTSKPSKKTNSIVDYLHEKICFAVEEAIKHSVPAVEEPIASTSAVEDGDETIAPEPSQIVPQISEVVEPVGPTRDLASPSIETAGDTVQQSADDVADGDPESPVRDTVSSPTESFVDPEKQSAVPINREPVPQSSDTIKEPVQIAQVVLHDLKNDKFMAEMLKEHEAKKACSKESEMEIHSLSETSSDIDDSILECDIDAEKENNKKKKHIDSVVQTLTQRKSSVDERVESHKSSNTKESNAMILDDNNEVISLLIIDESESNSPDSKSSDKSDKSRRKGIPAKVLSRSSSSTESSPSDEPTKSRLGQEVLDEVSGKFRRSSEDSNVTITVVTDNTPPLKKKNEIRTVNISKSLSLSVVNEPSASLEMECVGSDLEEKVVIDPIVKKLKPTARKTLPRPPSSCPIDLPSCSKTNDPDVVALTPNQRVAFPPRPALRVYGSGKAQQSGPPGLMSISSTTPSVQIDETSATEQIKEACKKMTGTLSTVVTNVLRGLSEAGNLEATVKLLQLELEQQRQRHKHEINEVIHNADMSMREHKALLEADKQRELLDAKHKFEMEKERVIQETKRKTWCTYCPKEATLYCCWNTAYCTYTCQQAHWGVHMELCSNKQQPDQVCRTVTTPQPLYNMPPPQMHAPDDAWYVDEEDQYESEGKGQKASARKRCGLCPGCLAQPCGDCYGCTNPKSHTVCRKRRCVLITARATQRMRQMMPPPVNPPSFSQPYRPNQMYTMANRFAHSLQQPKPQVVHSSPLDGLYIRPRGTP